MFVHSLVSSNRRYGGWSTAGETAISEAAEENGVFWHGDYQEAACQLRQPTTS